MFEMVMEKDQYNLAQRDDVTRGATELDLVYSGLEDTMVESVKETIKTADSFNVDFRTAAYINALTKIIRSYESAGITI